MENNLNLFYIIVFGEVDGFQTLLVKECTYTPTYHQYSIHVVLSLAFLVSAFVKECGSEKKKW